MRTNWLKKVSFALPWILLPLTIASAQTPLFQGKINSKNINVRSDSTVSSEVICTLNKGQQIEVVSEFYDWYKIRLPKSAPSFIKKNLAECINYKDQTQNHCQNAKALKNRINIRLRPDESSPILGKLDKNEIINICADIGGWYKIEPVQNSFGWIHKKFVNKVTPINKIKHAPPESIKKELDIIAIEGIIKPYGKVFKRTATHKLITTDNKIFLLKGDREGLNALNYHKVKIIGKKICLPRQKYPIIEIIKAEVIN